MHSAPSVASTPSDKSLLESLRSAQSEHYEPSDQEWLDAFKDEVERVVTRLDYLSDEQVLRFRDACFFMYQEHSDQRRRSGEPYAFHPLAVAMILSEVNFDVDTLIAGLLHDVIEDVTNPDGSKKWDTETLAAQPFVGDVVAQIVEGVTKIEKIDHITPDPYSSERREARTIVKTILATSKDIRVIMVKLADRLHNLRTMDAMKPSSQRKKARETLAVYAPIAARLGMETLRLRLTELSYRYAFPRLYKTAKQHLENQRPKVSATNQEIAEELTENLTANGIDVVKVTVHEPLVQHAIIEFQRLGNADAIEYRRLLRVVVKSTSDCYKSLGVLHKRFYHVNKSIRDYIAQPKENGYRSLDTQLFGKKGGRYDGVIRTEEMHNLAQTGAAGSFLKSYYASEGEIPDSTSQHYQKWFQNLVDIKTNMDSLDAFYDEFKDDLKPNDISVYTPKGEMLFFPKGATPIDFAYRVHTELGNRASKALVNSRYVPLNYQLKDGDVVKIIRDKKVRPDPTWYRFAMTPRARHAIRHYFNKLEDSRARSEGESLLHAMLRQFDCPLPENWSERLLNAVLEQYEGVDTIDQLYTSIGRGNRLPSNVVYDLEQAIIQDNQDGPPTKSQDQSTLNELYFQQSQLFGQTAPACDQCMPVPGDDVVVKFVPGEGMLIHHAYCTLLHKPQVKNEELHYFRWHENQDRHKASLKLIVNDRPGVLARICQIIAERDSNISRANVVELDGHNSRIELIINVYNLEQLNNIIYTLERQQNIFSAERPH